MHALLLRHEDQADLALLRAHAPSAGTALPRPARDHRHHQQIRHDFHRLGSSLLPGVKSSGALQLGEICVQRACPGKTVNVTVLFSEPFVQERSKKPL